MALTSSVLKKSKQQICPLIDLQHACVCVWMWVCVLGW